MGIFIEAFIELIGEALIEIIGNAIIWLMHLIVPDKTLSEEQLEKIKRIITVYTVISLIIFLIGIVFLLDSSLPAVFGTVGIFMTFIPLGLILIQIILGIIFRIVMNIKVKNK